MEIHLRVQRSQTDAVLTAPNDLSVRELWKEVTDYYGAVPSVVAMEVAARSGNQRVLRLAKLSPESDALVANLPFPPGRTRNVHVELPD